LLLQFLGLGFSIGLPPWKFFCRCPCSCTMFSQMVTLKRQNTAIANILNCFVTITSFHFLCAGRIYHKAFLESARGPALLRFLAPQSEDLSLETHFFAQKNLIFVRNWSKLTKCCFAIYTFYKNQ